jgi:hypothetical protein
MDFGVHKTWVSLGCGLGWVRGPKTLTVVYSAECKAVQKANRPVGILPILIVLFVFSYAILTALVVEQGRTIESQRALIREMLRDSNQLAALKNKMALEDGASSRQKSPASGSAQSERKGNSTKAPRMNRKDDKGGDNSSRSTKGVPSTPPSDLEDVRRSTDVI